MFDGDFDMSSSHIVAVDMANGIIAFVSLLTLSQTHIMLMIWECVRYELTRTTCENVAGSHALKHLNHIFLGTFD